VRDFRIITASHSWHKHAKKVPDQHEIWTPQNNDLTGRNFLNFVLATFTIASPGSHHCGQSYVALLMPGLSQGQSSWSITPAEFGCVFVQPHKLISLYSNTSYIYWPSLAPPPSHHTTQYICILHCRMNYITSPLNMAIILISTRDYTFLVNHTKNGSCCITQSFPQAKWRGTSKYQCLASSVLWVGILCTRSRMRLINMTECAQLHYHVYQSSSHSCSSSAELKRHAVVTAIKNKITN
jgi:hypothetical protein